MDTFLNDFRCQIHVRNIRADKNDGKRTLSLHLCSNVRRLLPTHSSCHQNVISNRGTRWNKWQLKVGGMGTLPRPILVPRRWDVEHGKERKRMEDDRKQGTRTGKEDRRRRRRNPLTESCQYVPRLSPFWRQELNFSPPHSEGSFLVSSSANDGRPCSGISSAFEDEASTTGSDTFDWLGKKRRGEEKDNHKSSQQALWDDLWQRRTNWKGNGDDDDEQEDSKRSCLSRIFTKDGTNISFQLVRATFTRVVQPRHCSPHLWHEVRLLGCMPRRMVMNRHPRFLDDRLFFLFSKKSFLELICSLGRCNLRACLWF